MVLFSRRGLLRALVGVCAAPLIAPASADTYPNRPLTIIVGFPTGGTGDIVARAFAQSLAKQLGQSVVVENKAGGGGTIGAMAVLRAPADGYTLLAGTPTEQVNGPFLMEKFPFDPARDFEPIGFLGRFPNVLVVNGKLPIHSVADLIKYAKNNQLNFGSGGNGNTTHLTAELFAQTAGIAATHIPYKGNAPAINDTMGGQVQMMFSSPASVLPHIKTGALRALAVTGATRSPDLPSVPTLSEAGMPLETYGWSGIFVSAKTPPAIIEKLHTAMDAALNEPAMLKFFDVNGGDRFKASREEAKRYLARERNIWGKLIRSRNIRLD